MAGYGVRERRARLPGQVATRRAHVAYLLVADLHGAGCRAPRLVDVPDACAGDRHHPRSAGFAEDVVPSLSLLFPLLRNSLEIPQTFLETCSTGIVYSVSQNLDGSERTGRGP